MMFCKASEIPGEAGGCEIGENCGAIVGAEGAALGGHNGLEAVNGAMEGLEAWKKGILAEN